LKKIQALVSEIIGRRMAAQTPLAQRAGHEAALTEAEAEMQAERIGACSFAEFLQKHRDREWSVPPGIIAEAYRKRLEGLTDAELFQLGEEQERIQREQARENPDGYGWGGTPPVYPENTIVYLTRIGQPVEPWTNRETVEAIDECNRITREKALPV
jgi:hypothetical protein